MYSKTTAKRYCTAVYRQKSKIITCVTNVTTFHFIHYNLYNQLYSYEKQTQNSINPAVKKY